MAENIQIELDHDEADVSVHILKNIALVEGQEQLLLSSLHNTDRIRAAKRVLRKIQVGQRQRLNHIENTQSSERNLTSSVHADNTRLLDENRALAKQLKEQNNLIMKIQKALDTDKIGYARGLLK